MDKYSLKPAELLLRTSSLANDLIAEEKKYKEALLSNLSDEHLQNIKDRIIFLKRKHLLYKQVQEMRVKNSK